MPLTKDPVSKVIYDSHMTRLKFWRKVVVRPFLWSRHDFISPRYPFEQVLQSNSFRLNMWNWLCCSLSVHVMISATDTSNALYKIHLQMNDAFTVAPTTELHDCLSRRSVIEMPKLNICILCMERKTFVFHYWLFNVTFNDISVIYVTTNACAGWPKNKFDLTSGSQAIDIS